MDMDFFHPPDASPSPSASEAPDDSQSPPPSEASGDSPARPSAGDISFTADCCICFEKYTRIYRQPISLLCGHTFCKQCVRKMLRRGNEFECALCRTTNVVVAGKMEKNITLSQILEKLNLFASDEGLEEDSNDSFEEIDPALIREDSATRWRMRIESIRERRSAQLLPENNDGYDQDDVDYSSDASSTTGSRRRLPSSSSDDEPTPSRSELPEAARSTFASYPRGIEVYPERYVPPGFNSDRNAPSSSTAPARRTAPSRREIPGVSMAGPPPGYDFYSGDDAPPRASWLRLFPATRRREVERRRVDMNAYANRRTVSTSSNEDLPPARTMTRRTVPRSTDPGQQQQQLRRHDSYSGIFSQWWTRDRRRSLRNEDDEDDDDIPYSVFRPNPVPSSTASRPSSMRERMFYEPRRTHGFNQDREISSSSFQPNPVRVSTAPRPLSTQDRQLYRPSSVSHFNDDQELPSSWFQANPVRVSTAPRLLSTLERQLNRHRSFANLYDDDRMVTFPQFRPFPPSRAFDTSDMIYHERQCRPRAASTGYDDMPASSWTSIPAPPVRMFRRRASRR